MDTKKNDNFKHKMGANMKNTENFIEHEIRIRLLKELMKKIDHKLNWMVGLIMGSIVLPVLLRSTGWI